MTGDLFRSAILVLALCIVGCGADPEPKSPHIRAALLAIDEMQSGSGEIVRAKLEGGPAFGSEVKVTDIFGREKPVTDGFGASTQRARLVTDGTSIYVWIPTNTDVPADSLIEVRAGKYGYYFESVLPDADRSIDELIRETMSDKRIPGLAAAVVSKGELMTVLTYGTANLELGVPVQTESVFELASLTKQMTATAILLLAEEAKLALDDPLPRYFEDIPAAWRKITIRQLLAHGSGLADRFEGVENGEYLMDYSKERMLRSAKETPVVSEPGKRWLYSDQGYFLLGLVIEQVTGESYQEFMQQRFFDTLGMTQTVLHTKEQLIPNRVAGYRLEDNEIRNIRRDWQFAMRSHFGVMSSISDMIKWEQGIASGFFSPEVLEQMWTSEWTLNEMDEGTVGYGFGWVVVNAGDWTLVEHTGVTGTYYLRAIDSDLGVIVLTNLGTDVSRLGRGIAMIVDPSLPFPKEAL